MLTSIKRYISSNHDLFYKIGLIVLCVSLIVYVFPKQGKFKFDYQKNKPWLHEDLIAPFDFAINKTDDEIKVEQKELLNNSKPYFKFDNSIFGKVAKDFTTVYDSEAAKEGISNKDKRYLKNKEFCLRVLNEIYGKGIIETTNQIDNKPSDYTVYVVSNNIAEEIELRNVFTIASAFDYLNIAITNEHDISIDLVTHVIENLLRHNILFDPTTTTKAQKESLDNISLSRDMKQKGERIISKGDIVSNDKYKILESLRAEYLLQTGGKSNLFYIYSGQFIMIGMSVLMMIIFLAIFRKEILSDNKILFFILLNIFCIAALVSLATKFKITSLYILPYCIFPILVRSFFDTRVAMFMYLSGILIIGIIVPNAYEFIFIQIMAGFFAVFSIFDMRNRKQLFFTVGIIFITYALAFISISIMQEGSLKSVDWVTLEWFGVSAISVLFVYPLIFVFEKYLVLFQR